MTRAAIAPPVHRPHRRNQNRFAGIRASQSRMPGPRNRTEYFDWIPNPADIPTRSHQTSFRDLFASASAQSAMPQKKTEGISGVMTMLPTPTISIALNQITVRSADRRSSKRAAVRHRKREPIPAETGARNLSAKVVSPKSALPSAIHQATMGA